MGNGNSKLKLLVRCKNNVQAQIAPLLKNVGEPQPRLGTGAGGDPKTQIDLVAETAITQTLVEDGVSFTLISEESGVKEFGTSPGDCFVTVDPIDGTTNLTRKIPFYATSIAVSTKPSLCTVDEALVADLFHGTTYTAEKGEGAQRDGERIAPSRNELLEEAVIGVDLNTYRAREIAPRLTQLIGRTKHVRHFGANALELCYVADGKSDAFVDLRGKLRATDVAAAWLIAQEAGALVTSPEGKSLSIMLDPTQRVEFVAAGNKKIHSLILNMTRC